MKKITSFRLHHILDSFPFSYINTLPETYLESRQTSKMKPFWKIVNGIHDKETHYAWTYLKFSRNAPY